MATITKIEEQKNKKRVNIFVDGSFFCGLNKETAVIFGLKTGKEIDEKRLEEAVFESEVKSAFEKSMDLIASRMHAKKELFLKLVQKGYSKLVAERAIEKLEEYNYVNDELFARQFVASYQNLSKKMLEMKLREKGVEASIISEVLGEVSNETQEELCRAQAEKYARGKTFESQKDIQKFYASLARKGFEFDLIKRVCKNLVKPADDFE